MWCVSVCFVPHQTLQKFTDKMPPSVFRESDAEMESYEKLLPLYCAHCCFVAVVIIVDSTVIVTPHRRHFRHVFPIILALLAFHR